MKGFIVFLGVATLSLPAFAAVTEGENLLVNGSFDAEQVDFPEFWTPILFHQGRGLPAHRRARGQEGGHRPARRCGATGTVSVRQQGMTLVAGETYKLSAYIKTKGFKSRTAGLIIHNAAGPPLPASRTSRPIPIGRSGRRPSPCFPPATTNMAWPCSPST